MDKLYLILLVLLTSLVGCTKEILTEDFALTATELTTTENQSSDHITGPKYNPASCLMTSPVGYNSMPDYLTQLTNCLYEPIYPSYQFPPVFSTQTILGDMGMIITTMESMMVGCLQV